MSTLIDRVLNRKNTLASNVVSLSNKIPGLYNQKQHKYITCNKINNWHQTLKLNIVLTLK